MGYCADYSPAFSVRSLVMGVTRLGAVGCLAWMSNSVNVAQRIGAFVIKKKWIHLSSLRMSYK